MVVTNPGEPVLAPVIGARACLIVREVVPGVAVFAVVLADRAPLAFAEVRAPLFPRAPPLPSLVKALLLGGIRNLYTKLLRHVLPLYVSMALAFCRTPDPAP